MFWGRRPKEEKGEVRDSPGPELANLLTEIRQLLDDHERRIRTVESRLSISPPEPVGKGEVEKPNLERKGTTETGKPYSSRA